MGFSLKTCIIILFWTSFVRNEQFGEPCKCLSVHQCEVLSQLSKQEVENFRQTRSCTTVTQSSDKINISQGYVCCPEKNEYRRNDVPLETSISFGIIPYNDSTYRERNTNITYNHIRGKRDESGNAGTVDSINSQINSSVPTNGTSNTRRNQNRTFRRNYEFPTFDRNGRPVFTNDNNAGRENRQTRRPTSTESNFDDTTAYNNMDSESTRRNQPRGRPMNMIQNQRPNMNIPEDNPYFMPQNPNVRQMPAGNSRNNNNMQRGNTQNVNNRNAGQCSALTSIPPDPSTGCCGRDPSLNMNRGYFGDRSQISNFSPDSSHSHLQAPTSFLGNFFDRLLNIGHDRFRRASDMNVTIDSRITGGQMTELNQFPWTVLLKSTFSYGNTASEFACGGSLISARYVLTAAHCVVDEAGPITEVEVTIAEFDKRTFPQDCIDGPDGMQCVTNMVTYADDIISHPQFDDERLQNDIALLRLRDRVPYTEFIRPICLPPIDIDSPDFSDLPLSVAGWGRNGRFNSNVKQSTVVNLVPQRECRRSYTQLTRRHLCAAGYSGEDTCKGDSGGPLMMLYEGQYYVSGVVSGKRADSPCGTSVPSLYTNVFHYLDWIRSNIRN